MINTSAFLELAPHAQREVILDGMMHIKAEIFKVSKSMAKLNGWMATMELAGVEPAYIERYKRLADQMQENIDGLTEQILVHAQKVRHLNGQIKAKPFRN